MSKLRFAAEDQKKSAFCYEAARRKMYDGDYGVAALWQEHAAAWAEDARNRLFAELQRRKSSERRSDLGK